VLNLNEISKFVLVAAGTGLALDSDKRRVVRLELNTSEPCQLRLQTGADDIRFLANVEGYQELTFVAPGPVTIWPDCEGEVWWWSPEMESHHVEVPDAETFTRIANRRERNPELERMMAKMQANAERRMAAMMGEVRGVVDEVRAENEQLKAEKRKRGKRPGASGAPAGEGEVEPAGEVQQPPAEGDDGGGGDAE